MCAARRKPLRKAWRSSAQVRSLKRCSTLLVSKGDAKLKPQWDTISFAKTKKVWRYTGHGWVHGATGASTSACVWAHSSLLVFQTLRVARSVLYKTTHYSRHRKLKCKFPKQQLPSPRLCFLSILLHNQLDCFYHPLKGCTPQPDRHSFQKHSSVNEKARARLRVAAFFPSLGKWINILGIWGSGMTKQWLKWMWSICVSMDRSGKHSVTWEGKVTE